MGSHVESVGSKSEEDWYLVDTSSCKVGAKRLRSLPIRVVSIRFPGLLSWYTWCTERLGTVSGQATPPFRLERSGAQQCRKGKFPSGDIRYPHAKRFKLRP